MIFFMLLHGVTLLLAPLAPADALAFVPDDALVVMSARDVGALHALRGDSVWLDWLESAAVDLREVVGEFDFELQRMQELGLPPLEELGAGVESAAVYAVPEGDDVAGGVHAVVAPELLEERWVSEFFDQLAEEANEAWTDEERGLEFWLVEGASSEWPYSVLVRGERHVGLTFAADADRARELARVEGGGAGLRAERDALSSDAQLEVLVDFGGVFRVLPPEELDMPEGGVDMVKALQSIGALYLGLELGAGEAIDALLSLDVGPGDMAARAVDLFQPADIEFLRWAPAGVDSVSVSGFDVLGYVELVIDFAALAAGVDAETLRGQIDSFEGFLGVHPVDDLLAHLDGQVLIHLESFLGMVEFLAAEELPAPESLPTLVYAFGLEDGLVFGDNLLDALDAAGVLQIAELRELGEHDVIDFSGTGFPFFLLATEEVFFLGLGADSLDHAAARLAGEDARSALDDDAFRTWAEEAGDASTLGFADAQGMLEFFLLLFEAPPADGAVDEEFQAVVEVVAMNAPVSLSGQVRNSMETVGTRVAFRMTKGN